MSAMKRIPVVFIILAAQSPCLADDGPSADERLQFMTLAAKSFSISADDSSDMFLLRPEPLMRWNNAISNASDGAIFMWTEPGGRPAAIVKFYKKQDGPWLHNLQSLSEHPFAASRGDEVVWNPRQPGITFELIPDAPPPANSTGQRRLQMRRLAREFQLKEQYQEQDTWNLRQLATPLMHYEATSAGVIDGGVFAFVVGTTPEAVLLLETHAAGTDANQQAVWKYALAPITGYAVTATRNDELIWSVDRRKLRQPITEPYTSDYFTSVLDVP